jgi:O-antigen ligase
MGITSLITRAISWGYALSISLLFFTVADQPLGREGKLPLSPTLLATVMVLPCPLLVVLRSLRERSAATLVQPLVRNGAPILFFATIAVISLLLSALPGAYWDEGGKWIFLTSYGFVLMTLSVYVPYAAPFARALPYLAVPSLALLLYSLWWDMTNPGILSELTNRAAGFPGNANFAALVTVFLCASALDYTRRRAIWLDLIILGETTVMVLGTMSRSGLIHLAVVWCMYGYYRFLRGGVQMRDVIRMTGAYTCVSFLLAAYFLPSLMELDIFQKNSRLVRVLNNEQVDDGSAGTRLAAAQDAIRLVNESPIIGHGTGHSRTMQELPHNLYLQQWVNNGVLGVVSYLLFLAVSLYTFISRGSPAGQTFVMVAITGSLFSHNVLDARPFLILYGVLLGSSGLPRASRTV